MKKLKHILIVISSLIALSQSALAGQPEGSYDDLVKLFHEWRAFEQPPVLRGAPDYTAATQARRHAALAGFRQRLDAFDIRDWPVAQQVDWHLVQAEMNGMDFDMRVLQPWARDPAFYTTVWTEESDTPAHEGPTHHGLVELWTYRFPLDKAAESRLAAGLAIIPPLLEQARGNLTGNAHDLWVAGIGMLRDQAQALQDLAGKTADAGPGLREAIGAARQATDGFVTWLEAQSASKTGPSGIGKDDYSWMLQNVYLVPMTWDEEVGLLQRELYRALASLKLEEHHNRKLPPMVPIASAKEYRQRADAAVKRFTAFLRDEEVLPPYPYIEAALRAHTGSFVPEASRTFFATVAHYEQLALWAHWYHWFDKGHMAFAPNPSPIRQGALLYNIWDNRSEGLATAFEEITMHAGLYEDQPRARELVWIMLAQRAARGLASLYAQANMFDLQQARAFQVAWTPRGWMRADLDLVGFEQLLYLRQPGYGTSYVTGKYLIDRLLAVYGRQHGDDFRLADFFGELDRVGVIPVSLVQWQITGDDSAVPEVVRQKP